uniref:Uncharacterized protein n=1 Tax=Oryza brachyantha TaxID=4533 RepID=J3MC52_ORYBR
MYTYKNYSKLLLICKNVVSLFLQKCKTMRANRVSAGVMFCSWTRKKRRGGGGGAGEHDYMSRPDLVNKYYKNPVQRNSSLDGFQTGPAHMLNHKIWTKNLKTHKCVPKDAEEKLPLNLCTSTFVETPA